MAIIYTYPVKTNPVGDDLILISDSADKNNTKQVKVSTLPSSGGGSVSSVGFSLNSLAAFTVTGDNPVTGSGTITLGTTGGSTGQYLDYQGNWSTPASTTYDVMGSGNGYAAGLVLAGNATHNNNFLRKDGTWAVPLKNTYTGSSGITLTGTNFTNADRGSSQFIFKNIAVSGQNAVIADSNNDTLTLVAGNNITLTTNNSSDSITIESSGGSGSSDKLGFSPASIYQATHEITSESSGRTIWRSSVVETDCTIDKVDFFVTAETGAPALTVAVYVGSMTSANRVLIGTSSALVTGVNTVTFATNYTFSAGDNIVIYTSLQGGEESCSIAGVTVLSNTLLCRQSLSYSSTPASSINAPETVGDRALALHFYDE